MDNLEKISEQELKRLVGWTDSIDKEDENFKSRALMRAVKKLGGQIPTQLDDDVYRLPKKYVSIVREQWQMRIIYTMILNDIYRKEGEYEERNFPPTLRLIR